MTCIYCHTVSAVEGQHNAALALADDGVMRGGISDPVVNPAHKMAYSALLDGGTRQSADMCGTCHDIVTPNGVHLERTYKEWTATLFSSDDPGQFNSCSHRHMHPSKGLAADAKGVKLRTLRDHSFPGVDVALTDFPMKESQREHVQEDLDSSLVAQLCVEITETTVQGADDPLAGAEVYEPGMTKDGKTGQVQFVLRDVNSGPPGIGNNVWEVEVRDADGKPLEGLELAAGTWMPEHNHGSPIIASSVDKGGGRYVVSPIELFMPGLWEITISANGSSGGSKVDDKAVFRFWASE